MFCSNCGSQIGEGDKYCKVCGTPVNVQAAAVLMLLFALSSCSDFIGSSSCS